MARECVEGAGRKGQLARWLRESTTWNFFSCRLRRVPSGRTHSLARRRRNARPRSAGCTAGGLSRPRQRRGRGARGHRHAHHDGRGVFPARNGRQPHPGAFHPSGDGPGQRPFDGRGTETNAQSNRNRGLIRRLREAVPARAQHAAARAVPVQARDWIVEHEVTGGIDWSRRRALRCAPT